MSRGDLVRIDPRYWCEPAPGRLAIVVQPGDPALVRPLERGEPAHYSMTVPRSLLLEPTEAERASVRLEVTT